MERRPGKVPRRDLRCGTIGLDGGAGEDLTGLWAWCLLHAMNARGSAMTLCSIFAFLAPASAAAQEIAVDGPIHACIALLLRDSTPADLEWSYWIAGGGGYRFGDDGKTSLGVLGVGTEATAQVATFSPNRYGGAFEFRTGPWWGVVSDFSGMRAEGGMLLSFGQVSHAQWGTYALRLGGGMGDDGLGLSPHVVATVTGGIRYAGARYTERGACDPKPTPKEVSFVSNVRLFATARATIEADRPWQLTFGLELDPTFFLPPYSLGKWIGAPP